MDGRTRQLVVGAQSGDTDQFNQLFERLAPALSAWACLRVGRHDAEEIVSEVWCRALRQLATFDPDLGSFRGWIFRIEKNVYREVLRARARHVHLGQQPANASRAFRLDEFPESATAISRRVMKNEGLQAFLSFVRDLGNAERALIIHCGLEGLTAAEAAKRLELTEAAVHKRWQRLRARLKESPQASRLLEATENC